MFLSPNIEAIDLAIFLKKERTLIFGDLHLGYEGDLNKKGILIPRFAMNDLQARLNAIIEKAKPKTIVINGDIKHEFGRISDDEWRWALRILDLLSQHCERLLIVKGNHDMIIEPIGRKRNIEMMSHMILGDTLIIHGDVLDKKFFKSHKELKTVIIGHEHPAIALTDSGRSEKFKCFLKGKVTIGLKRLTLIVMPSFQHVTEGIDVLTQERTSPFLQESISRFDCYVVGKNEILSFGKISTLKQKIPSASSCIA